MAAASKRGSPFRTNFAARLAMLKNSTKIPWSVHVVGAWNQAILSPIGVARRLFDLQKDVEYKIGVPIDGISPPRVGFQGIEVLVYRDRLYIEPNKNEYPELARAMAIGKRALEELPQTPVSAAGFNVQLTADKDFDPLVRLFKSEWDTKIANANCKLSAWGIQRTFDWNGGDVTLAVTQKGGENFELFVNFNKGSSDVPELRKWLGTPLDEFQAEVEKLVSQIAD